jgi:ATP-dependent DNA helicase RecG
LSVDPSVQKARTLALIDDLRALPAESAWVEFKENNTDPRMIGERISALSNAARMNDKDFAYILWGVRDGNHEAVGTSFEPSNQKKGNQPLEFWLAQRLKPGPHFTFQTVEYRGTRIVMLEIPAAATAPVEFEGEAYIRIGSATPRLAEHPERQRALWAKLQPFVWESGVAAQFLTGDEVLARLDYASYFELTKQPLPDNSAGIFELLSADRLVQQDVGGHWNITHLGAILFAQRLPDFSPSIARKAVRFIAYDGVNRAAKQTHRYEPELGYANGFKVLIDRIDSRLPHNEHIGRAFREALPLYPSIAIRELVANALIHQDMTITGTGPMIELFKDRMEITNPGQPLVNPQRFLDLPPRSRNEALAALMRRMKICEEQGTGIDKVLGAVELHQLPPPDFRTEGEALRVVLFAPRRFAAMTQDERIRACYQHAALRYVSGQRMTNSTLRERFGIEPQNAAQASVVIKQALAATLIRPAEPDRPKAGYLPHWA